MMRLGICTPTEDVDTRKDLNGLASSSAPLDVRVALTTRYRKTTRQLEADGRRILGVAAGDTFGGFGLEVSDPGTYRSCARQAFAEWGGRLDALQVGNEADVKEQGDRPGGASTSMSSAQFQELLRAFHEVWHPDGDHTFPLVAGGAGTGQPSYFEAIDFLGCYQLALHWYDLRVDGFGEYPGWGYADVRDQLGAFEHIRRRTGRPIVISEAGHTSRNELFGAAYLDRLVNLVAELGTDGDGVEIVDRLYWFCLYDWQHPPHGLMSGAAGGRQYTKLAYARMAAQLREHSSSTGSGSSPGSGSATIDRRRLALLTPAGRAAPRAGR